MFSTPTYNIGLSKTQTHDTKETKIWYEEIWNYTQQSWKPTGHNYKLIRNKYVARELVHLDQFQKAGWHLILTDTKATATHSGKNHRNNRKQI